MSVICLPSPLGVRLHVTSLFYHLQIPASELLHGMHKLHKFRLLLNSHYFLSFSRIFFLVVLVSLCIPIFLYLDYNLIASRGVFQHGVLVVVFWYIIGTPGLQRNTYSFVVSIGSSRWNRLVSHSPVIHPWVLQLQVYLHLIKYLNTDAPISASN